MQRPTKNQLEIAGMGVIAVSALTYRVRVSGWKPVAKAIGISMASKVVVSGVQLAARRYGR